MHGMHLSSKKKLSKTKISKFGTIIKIVFILAIVFDIEVVKIEANFLTSKAANT